MTDTNPPRPPEDDDRTAGWPAPPNQGPGQDEPPRYGQRLPGYGGGGSPSGSSSYPPSIPPDQSGQGWPSGYGQSYPGQQTPGTGQSGVGPAYGEQSYSGYGQPYPGQGYGNDYGSGAYGPYGAGGYQPPLSRGMAIGSLVLGLLALVTFCLPLLPVLLGLIALGLGIGAISKIRRGRGAGRGMAVTGMVTGGIGLVVGAMFTVAFASVLPQLPAVLSDVSEQCGNVPQSQQQECVQRVIEDWQSRL